MPEEHVGRQRKKETNREKKNKASQRASVTCMEALLLSLTAHRLLAQLVDILPRIC